MIFQYSISSNGTAEVEHRLKELALQHKVEIKKGLDVPVLLEGKLKHEGLKTINALLDQLESEREQWYYCNC